VRRACVGTGTSRDALLRDAYLSRVGLGTLGACCLYTRMPIPFPEQKLGKSLHTPDARCLIFTCKIPANSLYKRFSQC
jgi:hypothetical protein